MGPFAYSSIQFAYIWVIITGVLISENKFLCQSLPTCVHQYKGVGEMLQHTGYCYSFSALTAKD